MMTIAQNKALVLLPKVMAVPSLIACPWIMIHVLKSPKRKKTVYHRILFALSFHDWLFAWNNLIGTWGNPKELSSIIWLAQGTQQTCTAMGFFRQASLLTSVLYSFSLTLFFVLVVVYNWKEHVIRTKVEPWIHGICLSIGWATAVAGIPLDLYAPFPWGCGVVAIPPGCTQSYQATPEHPANCLRGDNAGIYSWAFLGAWIWATFLFIFVSMMLIYQKIKTTESKSQRYSRHHCYEPQTQTQTQPDDHNSGEISRHDHNINNNNNHQDNTHMMNEDSGTSAAVTINSNSSEANNCHTSNSNKNANDNSSHEATTNNKEETIPERQDQSAIDDDDDKNNNNNQGSNTIPHPSHILHTNGNESSSCHRNDPILASSITTTKIPATTTINTTTHTTLTMTHPTTRPGGRRRSSSNSSTTTNVARTRSRSREFAIQAALYCATFFLTYIFGTINIILVNFTNIGNVYGLMVLQTCLGPLQGFFNALVYVRPRYLALKRKYPTTSLCQILFWKGNFVFFNGNHRTTTNNNRHTHIHNDENNNNTNNIHYNNNNNTLNQQGSSTPKDNERSILRTRRRSSVDGWMISGLSSNSSSSMLDRASSSSAGLVVGGDESNTTTSNNNHHNDHHEDIIEKGNDDNCQRSEIDKNYNNKQRNKMVGFGDDIAKNDKSCTLEQRLQFDHNNNLVQKDDGDGDSDGDYLE